MISEILRTAISIIMLGIGLTGLCASEVRAADAPPLDTEPQALWSTPGDGRLVALARNAAGFDKAMPVRIRVCVTNLTGTNNQVNLYIWTTTGPQPGSQPPAQPQTRHLQLGECVEIDRPAALIIQDSTVSGTSSGYYRLLEESALPKGLAAANPDITTADTSKNHGRDIRIGAPNEPVSAPCSPLKSPTADFWASCQLPLPVGHHQGVRICIGTDYLNADDGKTQYAASLLDLIVDQGLMTKPKPSPYDYNWNPVTPDGCRDLIGATEAYFMVGPSSIGGYWDPAKVRSITVTTQTIDWTDKTK